MKVFLCFSFSPENLNPNEIADREVGEWFKRKITEYGQGRIEVITAEGAQPASIAEKVKQGIETCDVVFCLFCRRHQDPIGQFWLPSQYVLSESAYAKGRIDAQAQGKRLVGFV